MANDVYTEQNRNLAKQVANQGLMLQASSLLSAGAIALAALNHMGKNGKGNLGLTIGLGALGVAGLLYSYYKGVEYQIGLKEVSAQVKTNQLERLFDKGASKEDIIKASEAMEEDSWEEKARNRTSLQETLTR